MAEPSEGNSPSGQYDAEPTPERQAELEAAYEANRKKRAAPYDGVAIRTTGEVAWIVRQRGWSAKKGSQPDFRNADFRKSNLHKAQLQSANLVGARLDEAILTEAMLDSANLSDEGAARRRSFSLRIQSMVGTFLGAALIAYIVSGVVDALAPFTERAARKLRAFRPERKRRSPFVVHCGWA